MNTTNRIYKKYVQDIVNSIVSKVIINNEYKTEDAVLTYTVCIDEMIKMHTERLNERFGKTENEISRKALVELNHKKETWKSLLNLDVCIKIDGEYICDFVQHIKGILLTKTGISFTTKEIMIACGKI